MRQSFNALILVRKLTKWARKKLSKRAALIRILMSSEITNVLTVRLAPNGIYLEMNFKDVLKNASVVKLVNSMVTRLNLFVFHKINKLRELSLIVRSLKIVLMATKSALPGPSRLVINFQNVSTKSSVIEEQLIMKWERLEPAAWKKKFQLINLLSLNHWAKLHFSQWHLEVEPTKSVQLLHKLKIVVAHNLVVNLEISINV